MRSLRRHGPLAASVALLPLLCALAPLGAQEELTGEAIVRKAEKLHRAEDETGVIQMVLISPDQRKQARELQIMFKAGEDDDDKNLLRFLSPAAVSGTALLTIEASGRSDDQWIYLPALKKAKKIASADRTNRFAQTDFTYEDLRTEDFDGHSYTRLEDGTFDGQAVYVVEAKPEEGTTSGYSRRLLYVAKDRFLTLKVEYYDPKGKHQKTLLNQGYEQVSGLWRPARSVMEDHQRGSKTLWRFTDRKINPGLSDSAFTVSSLERGL